MCLMCRSSSKLAALPATDAQLTVDLVKARVQLQQADQTLQAARQICQEASRQAELQRLQLGTLAMQASHGDSVFLSCTSHN